MTSTVSRTALAGLAALAAAAYVTPAAADAVTDFYKGRSVTVLVTSGSGGLNALYGRTVGQFLGRHIPGKPNIIFQYMPGGGGLKGANYCYNIAPKDGSFICEPLNPLGLAQLLRPKGVKYDAAKFNYIGNASMQNGSFAVWHTLGINKLMDAKNKEVIFAGTGKGSESYYDPAIVNSLFGTKFKMVMGYKGGGALDLSLERGETFGRAGPLLSWAVRKPHWLKDGKIKILAQVGIKRMPGFKDVPLLSEFAKTDEQRKIIALISARAAIGRPFVVPPGTPSARVKALRTAFVATMKDPDFIAEAKKRKLWTEWTTGADVQAVIDKMMATPKGLVMKTRKVLGYAK